MCGGGGKTTNTNCFSPLGMLFSARLYPYWQIIVWSPICLSCYFHVCCDFIYNKKMQEDSCIQLFQIVLFKSCTYHVEATSPTAAVMKSIDGLVCFVSLRDTGTPLPSRIGKTIAFSKCKLNINTTGQLINIRVVIVSFTWDWRALIHHDMKL